MGSFPLFGIGRLGGGSSASSCSRARRPALFGPSPFIGITTIPIALI